MYDHGVVLFGTASAAFAAEKALLRAGLSGALVPVPRQLSSECGIAMRFDWEQVAEVSRVLEAAQVATAGIQRLAPVR